MTKNQKNIAAVVGIAALVLYFRNKGVAGIGSVNYDRVIPRDFFNESKLLKCMGRLSLHVLDNTVPDGIRVEVQENYSKFKISQDEMWGLIHVSNYPIYINDEQYMCGTTINSKEPYPFYCVKDDYEVEIFDDRGNFSADFIEEFRK